MPQPSRHRTWSHPHERSRRRLERELGRAGMNPSCAHDRGLDIGPGPPFRGVHFGAIIEV